ncbi:dipeptidase PepV [Bombilactobacillus thymidiniphilus]|uniref:Dipeptidase PepV n=1 Tax=Bombilactobacillus thymidiniphilus TaxID=2923363 RepID=A0ABY4PDX3_9LACO|nr:dipeptidase PepV [Bombilactobacillus thymidiniphilus]UQS83879.1 dipeptidase PepV [Bombilactobacillus thymidiniphilus]
MEWKQLAQAKQANLIADLAELVKINSSCDTEHQTSDYPLGPGPAKALQKVLSFGERDGFLTKNVDNLAGHIEYGSGTEILGILAHVDTVPAGEGWNTDPFQLTQVDQQLFGRGALDDKGPALAAYYALKILQEQSLLPTKKIRLIFGTDEESQWRGINHYFLSEPKPDLGFSPDAQFPLINGEKGIVSYALTFPQTTATKAAQQLLSFNSGLRDNMVPQTANAIIKTTQPQVLMTAFQEFIQQNKVISGNANLDNHQVTLKLAGKGSHAMEPENGVNAGTYLATFLAEQQLDEAGQNYVTFIKNYLHLDFYGQKSGVGYRDQIMGPLTQSPDIFKYESNQEGLIVINVRYPKGRSEIDLQKLYQNLTSQLMVKISGHAQEPHFVADDDPLVQKLLSAYRAQTGDNQNKPVTVGGGTYGRILPRGVAFGALMPDGANVMHQANEFITIDNLINATAIYAQAIWNLVK